MITLLNIYSDYPRVRHGAIDFLFELMKERDPEINISHSTMPSYEDHMRFVRSYPYRLWYLIAHANDDAWMGYISATHNNEIGIVLRKQYRGTGIGPLAIGLLMTMHDPNPHRSSLCNGRWLANIAPDNKHSQHMFEKLGFKLIQHTYAKQEEAHGHEDAAQELHQEPSANQQGPARTYPATEY